MVPLAVAPAETNRTVDGNPGVQSPVDTLPAIATSAWLLKLVNLKSFEALMRNPPPPPPALEPPIILVIQKRDANAIFSRGNSIF